MLGKLAGGCDRLGKMGGTMVSAIAAAAAGKHDECGHILRVTNREMIPVLARRRAALEAMEREHEMMAHASAA